MSDLYPSYAAVVMLMKQNDIGSLEFFASARIYEASYIEGLYSATVETGSLNL